MRYISTRGNAPVLGFADVTLAGLATDGGLYVPEVWPQVSPEIQREWRSLSYADLATQMMQPFVGGEIAEDAFAAIAHEAYGTFQHPAVTPLVQLDSNLWLQELFHGPTLAFKDVALQLLGRLFDHILAQRGERITIVGATSGDTGSAAIEACRDRDAVDIFILFPKGRVSPVQQRQMTTVDAPNVHCIAVEGTFDDCQDLVKALFADPAFRAEVNLSAVNSINWARVMAQTVYYAFAALQLGAPDRAIDVCVPTGNFGNIYAAYGAKLMGFPIERLIVGSNRNDILTRFFQRDDMSLRPVEPSFSPSMDIQVSSNVERLLFDLYDRNGATTAEAMATLRKEGRLSLGENRHAAAKAMFSAARFDDAETLEGIRSWQQRAACTLDPHSAVGVLAAEACVPTRERPVVVGATAHPAKFPDAVEQATGVRPSLPPRLADLFERPERKVDMTNDLGALQALVRERRG
ncbi:MAG TPA: threonine synthase [Alphaproteobacteria bacterium]|nr:threonine synthase [Alphaproteobacteria bacterium]